MIMQKENGINFLGSAVFVFLICLFLFAFAENQGKAQDARSDCKNTIELHFNPSAIIEVQQISFLNNLLPFAENLKFKFVNERPGLISFNNIIHHRISFLEKITLIIKPTLHPRFYNQYFASDTDDPFRLS